MLILKQLVIGPYTLEIAEHELFQVVYAQIRLLIYAGKVDYHNLFSFWMTTKTPDNVIEHSHWITRTSNPEPRIREILKESFVL